MNIYVKTGKQMTGMVLTGEHNKIYMYKAFENKGMSKQDQILLATQRGVAFVRNNKVKHAGDELNIYADASCDMGLIAQNAYLKRFNYPISFKKVNTEQERQHMLLASTEADMELRRIMVRGGGYAR